MFRGLALVAVSVLVLASLSPAAPRKHGTASADEKPSPSFTTTQLSMRVAALQTLHDLHAKSHQLSALKKLAGSTADTTQRDPNGPTTRSTQALEALRSALVGSTDENKIDNLIDQVDQAEEQENADLDDAVTITDAARQQTPDAVKLFSAAQVASLIASNADEIRDPAEIIKEALAHRHESNDDWESARDDAIEEIATLGAGLDAKAADAISQRVRQILHNNKGLDDKALKAKEKQLTSVAGKVLETVDSQQQINNWVNVQVARLLSNPQLPKAIDELAGY